jgi:hypothetical protein
LVDGAYSRIFTREATELAKQHRSKAHSSSRDHLTELVEGAPMRQTDSPVLGITATKLKFAAPTVSASAESWGAHSCTVQDNVTYGLSLSLSLSLL